MKAAKIYSEVKVLSEMLRRVDQQTERRIDALQDKISDLTQRTERLIKLAEQL